MESVVTQSTKGQVSILDVEPKDNQTEIIGKPQIKPGLTTNDLAEEQILGFFKDLSFEAKLAVVMTPTLLNGDHGTEKLIDSILNDFEQEILERIKEPATTVNEANLTEKEALMCGVILEQMVWHKYL